ncbi:MmcQ/YjbR family DNA-binding protein [Actinoplanes aureus]|uniref:MmcQ/YjbR family DNA-binding protein n=1 Tax=Actinoplanes aureus TaxID=2792083 RepID=A0A931FZF4_9ACTN|nr:MmcQ/YjbR family DNA-binding protein [Actinoplanes aureus]MBG0560339.1 MmcQ/YjbR family DNA-binding protein [Actinoplanes aureus]
MVTVDDVRRVARDLPRSQEHLIRDRVKFRVGQIVYVAFSRDEKEMGFGYPREERDALIASDPETFHLPRPSDLRYQWVEAWLERLDQERMTELVIDAWSMTVPKKVWTAYREGLSRG